MTTSERITKAPRRFATTGRVTALILLVGFIVQLNSERAYWFHTPEWFGSRVGETLGTAAYYGLAVAGALWALGRVPWRGVHQVVLMSAVFAWTVEGVIVYVVHEAGLFDPFFPAMFVGWHGLLSFVGFFYLVRRWLLDGRRRRLAMAGAVYGLIWGMWAVGSWLPDSDEAAGVEAYVPVEPGTFAVFAILVTVSLAVAHLLVDRVWPGGWRPGRASGWTILGITGLLGLASAFAIPYAPIRLAVLMAIPVGALIVSGRGPEPDEATFYEALSGRIDRRDLAGLATIPLVAAAVYGAVWAAAPSNETLEGLRAFHVLGQMTAGAGVLVWAVRRSLKSRRREPAEVSA